jgi:hypothetical protein
MSTYRLASQSAFAAFGHARGRKPAAGVVGRAILRNLRAAGFKGQFGLVNLHHAEIDGVATIDSLAKLPFAPELVVITAPAAAIPGLIDEAGKKGAAGAIIVSSGLGHGEGSLADAARLAAHMPVAGNLALITQSGAIAAGMVEWATQRGVGFSEIVSIGDQLDVDIADLLDYFALDDKTRAILLYVEAIKDAPQIHVGGAHRRACQAGHRSEIRSHGAKGPRPPRHTPARSPVRTPSMIPRSVERAYCGCPICANCSTEPRHWAASSRLLESGWRS